MKNIRAVLNFMLEFIDVIYRILRPLLKQVVILLACVGAFSIFAALSSGYMFRMNVFGKDYLVKSVQYKEKPRGFVFGEE